jgi:hypothetical protein
MNAASASALQHWSRRKISGRKVEEKNSVPKNFGNCNNQFIGSAVANG